MLLIMKKVFIEESVGLKAGYFMGQIVLRGRLEMLVKDK
jgi:hypothetical protein